jgi:hypothetical protein
MGHIPEEEWELPSCAFGVKAQNLDGVRVWVRVYFNCGSKPLELSTTNPDAQKEMGRRLKVAPA